METGFPAAFQGRCGVGPRIPLLVISPNARRNYVDHAVLTQSSILRFIEDNWHLGRIPALAGTAGTAGQVSFDRQSGSLAGMFDFSSGPRSSQPLILSPATGEPVR